MGVLVPCSTAVVLIVIPPVGIFDVNVTVTGKLLDRAVLVLAALVVKAMGSSGIGAGGFDFLQPIVKSMVRNPNPIIRYFIIYILLMNNLDFFDLPIRFFFNREHV